MKSFSRPLSFMFIGAALLASSVSFGQSTRGGDSSEEYNGTRIPVDVAESSAILCDETLDFPQAVAAHATKMGEILADMSALNWYFPTLYRRATRNVKVCFTKQPLASFHGTEIGDILSHPGKSLQTICHRDSGEIFCNSDRFAALHFTPGPGDTPISDEMLRSFVLFHEGVHYVIPDTTPAKEDKVFEFVHYVLRVVQQGSTPNELMDYAKRDDLEEPLAHDIHVLDSVREKVLALVDPAVPFSVTTASRAESHERSLNAAEVWEVLKNNQQVLDFQDVTHIEVATNGFEIQESDVDQLIADGHSAAEFFTLLPRFRGTCSPKLTAYALSNPELKLNGDEAQGYFYGALKEQASFGCVDVVKLLLADPRTTTENIKAAIATAANSPTPTMLMTLLAPGKVKLENDTFGADVLRNAIESAAQTGKFDTLKVLLGLGLSPKAKPTYGRTAADAATLYNTKPWYPELRDLLREAARKNKD